MLNGSFTHTHTLVERSLHWAMSVWCNFHLVQKHAKNWNKRRNMHLHASIVTYYIIICTTLTTTWTVGNIRKHFGNSFAMNQVLVDWTLPLTFCQNERNVCRLNFRKWWTWYYELCVVGGVAFDKIDSHKISGACGHLSDQPSKPM